VNMPSILVKMSKRRVVRDFLGHVWLCDISMLYGVTGIHMNITRMECTSSIRVHMI
jgi:hypothetical protein